MPSNSDADERFATYPMVPFRQMVGTHDVVLITLDSLRFDVAQRAHIQGETPNLSSLFPMGWECRHSPASFTLPSHVAIFTGFFPTPIATPRSPRLCAARIPGSEALASDTFIFDEASIPEALAARGYRTVCVGGVSFFANNEPVAKILPAFFQETFWKQRFGPGRKESIAEQHKVMEQVITETTTPLMLFLNVATTHHPTTQYLNDLTNVPVRGGKPEESIGSQTAALQHADRELGPLCELLLARRKTRPTFLMVCADHGDAFGEDGFWGHRLSHPVVMNVPYAHVVLDETFEPGVSPGVEATLDGSVSNSDDIARGFSSSCVTVSCAANSDSPGTAGSTLVGGGLL